MNDNTKKIAAISIAVIAILVIGGIATTGKSGMNMDSKTSASNSSMTEAVATNKVEIKDFSYSPAVITVKVHAMVTWTNTDNVGHTITADNTSPDAPASDTIAKGESYSFMFTKPGTYTYHCIPHPQMRGTVIVTD